MRRYTKADVEFHSDGYREGHPAINVKVYKSITPAVIADVNRDLGYELTEEWVDEQLDNDDQGTWFWSACEDEWEYAADYVREILSDYSLDIYAEGRQGGWMVVTGLPDLEDWDAVLLAKWRKCERVCREIADGIPYQIVSLLAINVWEPEQADVQEDRDAAASEGVPA